MEPIGFNRNRAAEIMKASDLDLLIATTPVNVYYLSGLPTSHVAPNPILFALSNQYPNVAMLRREGDVTLFNWALFRSVDTLCWAADHQGIFNQESLKSALWSKIEQAGLKGKRIGVESWAPKYILDHLAQKDPDSQIVAADQAFLDMRLIKSDEEISLIERATEITEKAIMACVEAAREGITDNDFLRLARKTMVEEGADGWDHLTLSIGDSDPEAPGIGTVARAGDIVRLDFGAVFKGYVADVNRHVVLGPIPDAAAELIERLIQFQEYYEQHIKPGASIKQVNEGAMAYYKTIRPEGNTWSVGHSIGLECEEAHLFGSYEVLDRPFEKNMVFEIEAWEPFSGTLIGVEDCYVVTETGCRKITTLDKHMISAGER
jgi:Xaa-Pro aminopeptidase